jgi:hypothetical protein
LVAAQRSFDITRRRSERKRDAVPNAAPTLRTIDPTRRRTCIFGSLAGNIASPGPVVVF